MNVENELKHKACNIDLFAKKAIEDVVALGEYSCLLLDQANQIQMEMEMLREQNKKLRQKLNKAKEALKFYADSDCYEDFGRYSLSEVDEDGGEWAQKVLDEIKDNGL